MKKIGIVIVNFNGEQDVIACLSSLNRLNIKNITVQIYIVDNASHMNSISAIEKYVQNNTEGLSPVIIKNKINTGFTGGYNCGATQAMQDGCEYVLLLNPDTLVDEALLQELLKSIEGNKNIAAVMPKIYFAKGYEYHKERYTDKDLGNVIWYAGGEMDWANVIGYSRGVNEVDSGQFDTNTTTNLATGCCMLIPSAVIKKIGLFKNEYFMYYEDAEWSMRVTDAGYTLGFAPKAVVWHKNATSSGGSGSSLQDYYITRNRLLFGLTYASLRSKIALIRESFTLLLSGRKWQKKGVRDFYFHNLGKGSYAAS